MWFAITKVTGVDLPWLVVDQDGTDVAQFRNRLDAELFTYARPVLLCGPGAMPQSLRQELGVLNG